MSYIAMRLRRSEDTDFDTYRLPVARKVAAPEVLRLNSIGIKVDVVGDGLLEV